MRPRLGTTVAAQGNRHLGNAMHIPLALSLGTPCGQPLPLGPMFPNFPRLGGSRNLSAPQPNPVLPLYPTRRLSR